MLSLLLLMLPISQAAALEELYRLEVLKEITKRDHRPIGWEWHYIDQDGKPGLMRKTAATENTASYQRSDGCEWTRQTRGFAPATVWSDCPSSGQASVEFLDGQIWPLRIGNRFRYQMHGKSSMLSFKWSSKRSCEVIYAVRIKTVSGEYDTFRLECQERWGTRSWWLSPKVGTAVAYQQKTNRNDIILQEMTRIVVPQ
ncbi:MAG: hypothetical protein AAF353_08780 [Pseudomonadota bacterium]